MFLMLSAASLCGVVLIAGLTRLACRHRPDLWFTSDDAFLCVVSPVLIALLTAGGVSLGYGLTHGSLRAIPVEGWIGSASIIAGSTVLWRHLARALRNGGRAKSTPATAVH